MQFKLPWRRLPRTILTAHQWLAQEAAEPQPADDYEATCLDLGFDPLAGKQVAR